MSIERHSQKVKILRVPEGLSARCMRLYDWSEGFTDRAILGYRRLMTLKAQNGDWGASILSPPIPVEKVWQQHILDVDHYVFACDEFCGRRIGHNPDDGISDEKEGRAERIKATMIAYKSLYGPIVDEEVWSFDEDDENEDESDKEDEEEKPRPKIEFHLPQRTIRERSSRKRCPPEAFIRERDTSNSSNSNSNNNIRKRSRVAAAVPQPQPRTNEPLTIRVGRYVGETYNVTFFKIKPDTRMKKVFDRFALHWNMPADDFSFIFGNRTVQPQHTALCLGLQESDMIYATRSSAIED